MEKYDVVWLNADKIRDEFKDWDFSYNGRIRQADRMRWMSIQHKSVNPNRVIIVDMVAALRTQRTIVNPDYVILMDTIKAGRYEDTNAAFEYPEFPDFVVDSFSDEINTILFTKMIEEIDNRIPHQR